MPKRVQGFQKGSLNPSYGKHARNYKGGTVTKSGSRKVSYLESKINGKRVKIHRHIMEKFLGRKLKPNEIIHHINGDGVDNRLENLTVTNQFDHKQLHQTNN